MYLGFGSKSVSGITCNQALFPWEACTFSWQQLLRIVTWWFGVTSLPSLYLLMFMFSVMSIRDKMLLWLLSPSTPVVKISYASCIRNCPNCLDFLHGKPSHNTTGHLRYLEGINVRWHTVAIWLYVYVYVCVSLSVSVWQYVCVHACVLCVHACVLCVYVCVCACVRVHFVEGSHYHYLFNSPF